MKTTLLLILGLLISFTAFSKKGKELKFVPSGNFEIQANNTRQTISVDNFWMSNEISNKEFRQFFNQIKNTPNDSMLWFDVVSLKNGAMNKPKIIKVAYSDVFDKLMDESAWKSIFEGGDYFTNPKYDDYPVVGVTWEGAKYYCIWLTKEENKKIDGQDNVMKMDYRLPTQYEWEYALSFSDSKSIVDSQELHPIDSGDKNKLGLFNLNSNVSEWTSSSGSNDGSAYKVVKGGSWKNDTKITQQELVLPNRGTDYIGFRIVQSGKVKQ